MPDSLRPFDDTGIIVMKTVDVRPDLDLFSLDGCPYQCGGIVAASSFQVVDFAVSIPADKALGNDQGVGVRLGQFVSGFAGYKNNPVRSLYRYAYIPGLTKACCSLRILPGNNASTW